MLQAAVLLQGSLFVSDVLYSRSNTNPDVPSDAVEFLG